MMPILLSLFVGQPALASDDVILPAGNEDPGTQVPPEGQPLAIPSSPAPSSPPPSSPPPDLSRLKPPTWGEQIRGRPSFGVAYTMGLAVGPSYSFTPRFSGRGIAGDVHYHVTPRISVGVGSGYQLMTDKLRETVTYDYAAITATMFHYLDVVPIHAQARYYAFHDKPASMVVGLGIGTDWTRSERDNGYFVEREEGWHFGLAPELGAMVHLRTLDLEFKVRYHWAAGNKKVGEQMWMSFDLGMRFR